LARSAAARGFLRAVRLDAASVERAVRDAHARRAQITLNASARAELHGLRARYCPGDGALDANCGTAHVAEHLTRVRYDYVSVRLHVTFHSALNLEIT
jgi:hypothetical protein